MILIETSYQDHERAYFDSADWALGKVIDFLPNIIEFDINHSEKCDICSCLFCSFSKVVFPTSLKVLLKHFDRNFR
jgi:hypothetical protein